MNFTMTQGSLTPTTYPSEIITVVCDECGREGEYARDALIERYGADMPMPDILNRITDCTRLHQRIGVRRCLVSCEVSS